MKRPARPLVYSALAIAVALAALLVTAAPKSPQQGIEPLDQNSADIPRSQLQRKLALTGAQVRSSTVRASASAAAAVTDEEVGDSDSFGRNVHWLGLADMAVELTDACSPADPGLGCQILNPAPAITPFAFEDLGHITLPGKSAHSLLCYWFSPVLTVGYDNPTATQATARFRYTPTLTIENEVLSTPGLIDPNTGLPFDGKLLTSMTSSEIFEVPLSPGVQFIERTRDSTVCIAGFINRKSLIQNYGLTEAQAKQFFKKPITVRMNISGSAQYVNFASMYFGLRIVGD